MLEHPEERPEANMLIANMRDKFIMSQALVIAINSMAQITDVRYAEPSNMFDMAALAKCPLFEVFTEIHLLEGKYSHAKELIDSVQVVYTEGASNE
jgi:hypothetical protein